MDTLGLGHNNITVIEGLEHLPALEDLWLNGNPIASYDAITGLSQATALQTLYLEHSPLARDFQYGMRVPQVCTSLTQLDANPVRRR